MKSLKKNYVYNMCYQILAMITPLITMPYISRVLQADGIGQVSYAESITSYFTIFAALGISAHGQREISYVQTSLDERSRVFWNIKILECMVSAVVLVLFAFFSVRQADSLMYFALSFNILAVFADITWLFQGIEEFEKLTSRNSILKVLYVIFIFTFVRTKEDLYWYAFSWAFFSFLSNLVLWLFLPQFVNKPCLKELRPFRDFNVMISLFLPTIAIQIYTVLDKTMIGIITGSSIENGYYEQAYRLVYAGVMLVTTLGMVTMPRAGYYVGSNDIEALKTLIYKVFQGCFFVGIPMCLGLIGVSDNFVEWFYGPGYGPVGSLIKVLALLILVIGISKITAGQYLVPMRMQHLYTRTLFIGAGINFVLNLFLIKKLGAMGAAIASVVAESSIVVMQLYIVRKALSIKRILHEGRKYFISGVIMLITISFAQIFFAPTIVCTVTQVVLGATVYFAMLWGLRDDFFLENTEKAVAMLIRKKHNSQQKRKETSD